MWNMWKMCYGIVNKGGSNLIFIEKIEANNGQVLVSIEHIVWKKMSTHAHYWPARRHEKIGYMRVFKRDTP